MSLSGHRPDFDRPPVVEVVCGVQFEDLDHWQSPHYGQFWARIQKEYSEIQDQPPLPRIHLEPTSLTGPPVRMLPPLRRVLFIEPPGNFLIQVQQNRFHHNWRKVKDDDTYVRFDAAYRRFTGSWQQFTTFLSDVGLPEPRPEIWELSYINHIMAEGVSFPRNVWDFLGFYERSPQATTAMEASAMKIQFVWPLPDKLGSLTFDVKHGNRTADQREVLVMELTARGKAEPDDTARESWFDVAHDAIVNTFEKLTTEHAHELWGQRK